MSFRIITDSAADLPREIIQKYEVEIEPMQVFFGDEGYYDGVEISKDEFYKKLAHAKKLPTTTQINIDTFEKLFEKDERPVLGIFISSQLSGTGQSAKIAADSFKNKEIFIIDSLNATMGMSVLVIKALMMREEGKSLKDTYETIQKLTEKVRLYAAVDSLKYLKAGGRLSGASAIIGTALGIHPIMEVKDGKVSALGKERGLKKSHQAVVDFAKKCNIDYDMPIILGHSNDEEMLEAFKKVIGAQIDISKANVCEIGVTVGTHAGPGCVGISFVEKD